MLGLLALVALPAGAEWVKGCESLEAVVYIDPATLRRDGELRRVMVLYDLRARGSTGELSVSALHEFDCKGERWRILGTTVHSGPMATDAVIRSDASSSEWNDPIPGTPPAACFKFVCPHPRFILLRPPP